MPKLTFSIGSRTVGVRGLLRESRAVWRTRFADPIAVEKQRRESGNLCFSVEHRVGPAVRRPEGGKVRGPFRRSPDGPQLGPRAISQGLNSRGGRSGPAGAVFRPFCGDSSDEVAILRRF
jgi:hypothetical protein